MKLLGVLITIYCIASTLAIDVNVPSNGMADLNPVVNDGKSETEWTITTSANCHILLSCAVKGEESCDDVSIVTKDGDKERKLCPMATNSFTVQDFINEKVYVKIMTTGKDYKASCKAYSITNPKQPNQA
uniref:Venom CUB domain-containing protein 1 n=1 Tax=Platymeris rhadamanthus TaxID=1134088 RepID=CUB1_PLARH|nr:RecName: Full=Venom CUB domain-containing protein 1; Flags: Precursor [Platymeris rhadamanthus]QHB21495.1 venom CUB domain protein 1 [Platymeris rhadamanthus]